MKRKYTPALLFIILFLFSGNVFSQVWPGPHPLLSSRFKVNAEGQIASQVDTFESKWGYEKAEAEFGIPLYHGKDWLTSTGNTPLIGVTLQGAGSILHPEGGFIDDSKQLIRLRLGSNFIYSRGLRNLYFLNAQGIVARELDLFSLSGVYINGSAFWRHRQNDQFGWTLGVLYTSMLGKNKLLPLAGINWRPQKENLVSILFPAYIKYTHFFGRSTSLSVTLKPNGGFYKLNTSVNDTSKVNQVLFSHRNIFLSATVLVKLSYQLSIEPEVGWASGTRLSIDGTVYNTSPSLFARIALRYKFGQRANVAPILDFDPADFTTSDPEIPEN